MVGYLERTDEPVIRRQPAGSLVPLVLSLGPTLEILELSAGGGTGSRSSFIAGLMPGYATTSFDASQYCLQIYLTPLGVGHLLGVPGRELAGNLVDVEEVVPALGGSFLDKVRGASTWSERFALAERELLQLLGSGAEHDPLVSWMWQEIHGSGGRARIGELVLQTGWSQRHVTSRFFQRIGLTPKAAASIVRFERASHGLTRQPLSRVASRFGYSDQSHLTREFVRLSGTTPHELSKGRFTTAHTAIGRTQIPD
ncbi:helix-turn-helix domain-containing protein [Aeromicrobium sp. 9AM]|uniref:helix-turn-helix domain-containing protein n=1 Tax=Aeromicrobium sp. 9AM TaxID=2653126 RepID=UPI001358B679|nr:helix-turn-helix domain-containing protein [Aeromicrobium sp. 9AM]